MTKLSHYPEMFIRDNKMPSFGEIGYWREDAKRDFDYAISGTILSGPFGALPAEELKACDKLGSMMWETPATRHRFESEWDANYEAKHLIENAVKRYFDLYGTEDYDPHHAWSVVHHFIVAVTQEALQIALAVPILMHHFEADRFRLDDDSYIIRMRKPLQLSRAANVFGFGGVSKSVIGSATHAFVNTRWSIRNMRSTQLALRLVDPSDATFSTIDEFFAALRIATNATSGYAQVLYVPRGWAYGYKWDLPALYSSEHRRYPSDYDSSLFWSNDAVRTIPNELLPDVRDIYKQVRSAKQNNMELALRRLNTCVTRDDDVDAILDAIIGIELLLSGDRTDSITYKLRMRVAGLAKLTGGRFNAATAFSDMSQLYSTRSDIVHGNASKKRNKDIEDKKRSQYRQHREMATKYLRMVLQTLLEHSRYRNPSNIDSDLLINFGISTGTEQVDQADLPGMQ
ncbi:HEPN domain-containing protein [Rhizobium sp. Leaf262]|uniref:HEPN domain-containing protein n=1 Tax=Rhizobium sp. Leaf262 TaxID=1736312 RepID=UPI0012E7B37D|nr:HEPN domain-containing protein [Rhizobium sp. Leaf262]